MVATSMSPAQARARADYFFVWMAGLFVLVAFGGFAGTYWLQLPAGTFRGPALMHLHGLLFSAWTLLFLSQTVLGANRSIAQHRAWGMAGIAIVTAITFVSLAVAIRSVTHAPAWGDSARQFLIVPVTAIAMFAGYFAAAVANVRRPDWHKRLMLVGTASILDAAVARIFFLLATGGGPGARPGNVAPPPASLAGELQTDAVSFLVILAGAAYDWRTRGRPHPAYLIGFGVLAAVALLRVYAGTSPQWLAIADWLTGFGA